LPKKDIAGLPYTIIENSSFLMVMGLLVNQKAGTAKTSVVLTLAVPCLKEHLVFLTLLYPALI